MILNIRPLLNPAGRLVFSALLTLAAAGCVHSPRHSMQDIQSEAAKGHAQAQYELAGCYANGTDVSQDHALAVKYLQLSAEQGYRYAETDLGSCYARGLGVKKDLTTAVQWYKKAAAQGDSLARSEERRVGKECRYRWVRRR